MIVEFVGLKKFCARAAVIGMVGLGASACSSMPDWVDPTNWFGGGPSDTEASAGTTPDLAAIPDRPAPASTADEQQQVASSLAADRAQAKYSADALRGGTETAAPPPPPADASNEAAAPQSGSTPPATTSSASPSASNPQVASNEPPQTQTAPPPPPASSADVSASATQAAPPPPPPAATQLPPPAAAAAMPSSGQQSQTTMAMVSPSDAALGFKPSSAPPLDPSIGMFVPPPLIAHYDQTANAAGIVGNTRVATSTPVRTHGKAVGGPEKMTGAVVANLDALQAPSTAAALSYSAGGMTPASVVLFPGDGTLLNARAKLQVRAAVEQFKRSGGQGFIRIVGHASSRTSNMPLEKHLEVIFNKSQDRANAVAQEIIKQGVPANRVLVEAVGDSQPVYYESMPQGEDGNRRAEIFLQS